MFKPNFIINNITDIKADFLKDKGIKALLLDVDNTLTVGHKNKTLRDGVEAFLEEMRNEGILLLVLSNAKTDRAKAFAAALGLDAVGMAAKPLPFGYIKAVKKLGVKRGETALVGDQVFTDVLGGKIAGVKTFLATDIVPETEASFKIRRYFERKLLKRWK